jgi:hypothetical protein
LWATGIYYLKVSPNDFWHLTMPRFKALKECYAVDQEWLNHRSAIICAVIANVNRDPKKHKKPYTAQDFMPQKERKLSGEQIMKQAKTITMMLGGDIINGDSI